MGLGEVLEGLRCRLHGEASEAAWGGVCAFLLRAEEFLEAKERLLVADYVRALLERGGERWRLVARFVPTAWADALGAVGGGSAEGGVEGGGEVGRAVVEGLGLEGVAWVWGGSGEHRTRQGEARWERGEEGLVKVEPLIMGRAVVGDALWGEIVGARRPWEGLGGDAGLEGGVTWWEAVAFCNALSRRDGLEEAYLFGRKHGALGDVDFHVGRVAWRGSRCAGWRLPTEAEWIVWMQQGGPWRLLRGLGEGGPEDPWEMGELARWRSAWGLEAESVGQTFWEKQGENRLAFGFPEWCWDDWPIFAHNPDNHEPERSCRSMRWESSGAVTSQGEGAFAWEREHREGRLGFRVCRSAWEGAEGLREGACPQGSRP